MEGEGESGDRQEGGRGRVGLVTGEWGGRGSVDRHEWEGGGERVQTVGWEGREWGYTGGGVGWEGREWG